MNVRSQLSVLNSRLLVAFLVILPWMLVRNDVSFLTSSLRVIVEWAGLILLAVLLCRVGEVDRRLVIPSVVGLSAVILLSIWERPEWPDWPMYWRGFGPRVAVGALMVAAVLLVVVRQVDARRNGQLSLGYSDGLNRWSWRAGVVVSIWLIPSVLQPMDAWLNIGDATQIVLEEISGWAVGHIPGYQQASGYSSMLGLPLAILGAFTGRNATKITLVALWANLLVILVPITMAAMLRRIFTSLAFPLLLAIALISVTISGDSLGSSFYLNTSIFRELSFVSRLLPPLLLGYSLLRVASSPMVKPLHTAVLAVGAGVVSLNNFEFGFGAAGACLLTIAVLIWRQQHRWRYLLEWIVTFVTTWIVSLIPALWIDGSVLRRRLGAFNLLTTGETDLFQANGGGQAPVFGLLGIIFALAAATVGIAMVSLYRSTSEGAARVAGVTALYFSLWTILSAPYALYSGGAGGTETQLYFPIFLMLTFALVKLILSDGIRLVLSHLEDSPNRSHLSLSQLTSLLPLFLLIGLTFSAIQQVPAGYREWRRIQTPVSEEKWVDEWSAEKLDWIETSKVLELAEPFGSAADMGWWYQHGSAIEILTGIENLLGITGYEGIRSAVVLQLACEPLVMSSKKYVIALRGATSTLERCKGISARELTLGADDFPLAVYEVSRDHSP